MTRHNFVKRGEKRVDDWQDAFETLRCKILDTASDSLRRSQRLADGILDVTEAIMNDLVVPAAQPIVTIGARQVRRFSRMARLSYR